ncbi:hypothetical protein Hanom_Chr13g01211141 [Helianthus anomalus]
MHDAMGWLMTAISEMYKYIGISVPPCPPPRIYSDRGPFYMQQPDPSIPSFTQPITSMLIFTQPISYMKARTIRYTTRHPLLGVTQTLRRRSSLSLTRIDDDNGLCYFYMTQYCTNNLIIMF